MSEGGLRLGTIYRRELLKALPLPTTGRILDVGCLDGHILNSLKAEQKVGVDLSPIANRNVDMLQADACRLPFVDQYFDFILALDVIEHVSDDQGFVLSLDRVLKPGGRILLTTPSRFIRITPGFLTDFVSKKWGHTLRYGYSLDELRSLFDNTSIEINVRYFSAINYRRFYLLARSLYTILPSVISNWITWMARQDVQKSPEKQGFVILEGEKRHRNQNG